MYVDYINSETENETKSDIIFVSLNTFPTTLKNTQFYKSIYKNHEMKNPKIPLPMSIYKNEMNLSTLYDMCSILLELDKIMPNSNALDKNYDFILQNKISIKPYLKKLKIKFESFSFIDEIEILIDTDEEEILDKIIIGNHIQLLEYCLIRNLFNITSQKVFDKANEYFNLNILEYIFKRHKFNKFYT